MKTFAYTLALLAFVMQTARAEAWKGNAEIQFNGTSTLHDWAGKVKAEPFAAHLTRDAAGKPEHLTAKVEVKVTGMDTAEPKRDENMRKAMKAASFPLVTGTIDAPFSEIMSPQSHQPAILPLTLELLGRKHQVKARISQWSEKDKTASFDLDFSLSLKECGIEVPSMLLVVRVGDTIKLHASVKLVRSNP